MIMNNDVVKQIRRARARRLDLLYPRPARDGQRWYRHSEPCAFEQVQVVTSDERAVFGSGLQNVCRLLRRIQNEADLQGLKPRRLDTFQVDAEHERAYIDHLDELERLADTCGLTDDQALDFLGVWRTSVDDVDEFTDDGDELSRWCTEAAGRPEVSPARFVANARALMNARQLRPCVLMEGLGLRRLDPVSWGRGCFTVVALEPVPTTPSWTTAAQLQVAFRQGRGDAVVCRLMRGLLHDVLWAGVGSGVLLTTDLFGDVPDVDEDDDDEGCADFTPLSYDIADLACNW